MDALRCGVLFAIFLVKLAVCGTIPGPPTDLQVSDIQRNNMTISWKRPTNDGNSTQLEYTVFYKENSGECWAEEYIVKETKATLSKLKPYRKYDIFVMVSNKTGYGPPSVRVSDTTLEAEPESCPGEIHIDLVCNATTKQIDFITIAWSTISEKDKNGKLKGHKIFYKNSTMKDDAVKDVPIADGEDFIEWKNFNGVGFKFKVAAYTSAGLCKGYQNLTYESGPKTTACLTSSLTSSSALQATPTSNTQTSTIVIQTPTPLPTTTTQQSPTSTHVSATPTTVTPTTTSQISPTPTTTVTPTTPGITTRPTEETSQPTEPTKEPVKCTQEPTEPKTEKPAEKLASTKEKGWLLYVAIALAVIVVIMGITIFMLIWQLYKNHRFYKLNRQEQYALSSQKNIGHNNQGQDNP